jgi:uncharacterized membrane protein
VIRTGLPLSAPFDWLRRGADDLKAGGFASLFYGMCFAAGGLLLFLAFRHAVQLVTAVTAGFMLLGPFLALGLYELSRRRETGEPLSLTATLAVWKRNLGCFGIYSLILIVIYLVWARASLVMFYEGGMPTLGSFMTQILKFDNIEFLLAYLVVGGFFAALVFAFSVVSIPMMLERNQDTVTAMLASFLALVRNLPMMLIWGGLIVMLTAIGIATGFLGLIVTMPLVGHATWHAYRALIEAPAP